jgi:hypothetical protein
MIIYDKIMLLSKNATITNFGTKFITSFFCMKNTQEIIYIVAIYKPTRMQTSYFNSILESILKEMFSKKSFNNNN